MGGRGKERWMVAGGRGEEREGMEAKRKEKMEEDDETKRWDGTSKTEERKEMGGSGG